MIGTTIVQNLKSLIVYFLIKKNNFWNRQQTFFVQTYPGFFKATNN